MRGKGLEEGGGEDVTKGRDDGRVGGRPNVGPVLIGHWLTSCELRFGRSVESSCFFSVVFICGQNYTLEWFSEAGSAPIRSAVKFYFDIDVRIFFQLLQKIFFRSIKKKVGKKVGNFQKS